MTIAIQHVLLRANATFLLAASAGGFASDVRGIFFGLGPVARLVADAPYAGLGFIEAHGLAFILGIQCGALSLRAAGTSRLRPFMSCWGPPTWYSGSSSLCPTCCWSVTSPRRCMACSSCCRCLPRSQPGCRTALRFTPVRFRPAIDNGDAHDP